MKEKYRFSQNSEEITIQPYFAYKMKVWILFVLSALVFGIIPYVGDTVSYDVRTTAYAIAGVMTAVALYDYLFRIHVKFLFDKRTSSIYKINGPLLKSRLMSFDEMTIINTTQHGEMEYAIAPKKNQFVRNYSISDSFGSGAKSLKREEVYIEEILNPILNFVKS